MRLQFWTFVNVEYLCIAISPSSTQTHRAVVSDKALSMSLIDLSAHKCLTLSWNEDIKLFNRLTMSKHMTKYKLILNDT